MPTSTPVSTEPVLVQLGTDHTIAPLAVRERLALSGDVAADLLVALHADPAIAEVAILSTCNRTEIYIAATEVAAAIGRVRTVFAALLDGTGADMDEMVLVRRETEVVRHLCAVAAGLQSMVVAEGQILGQVREAFEHAQRLGTAGPQVSAAFRAAVACGKRVRSETALGRAEISISSVLLDLLGRQIEDWSSQQVLLIGSGRISQVTAERLRALGSGQITVTSRTLAAAERLAQAVGGQAVAIEALPMLVPTATLIISATRSPGLMVTPDLLASRPASMLIADLAVPRDVDPAVRQLPGVRLIDIDDLRDMQDRHEMGAALALAATMVDQAAADWQVWCRTREAVPLIADLRAHVDRQKEAELARALAHLEHLPAEDRVVVSEMAHRLVNKMFHHLAIRMKQAAADPEMGASYLEAARFLFQRDEQGGEGHGPRSTGAAASGFPVLETAAPIVGEHLERPSAAPIAARLIE